MKRDTTTILNESTVDGEKIVMGIAEEARGHIMDVLTNLYSDPELAIIREYSTNAWDSHVAAGQTRPIEVRTPQSYYGDQTLSIKDYGTGLSVDDIHTIYSQYGVSTKRDSDDFNGTLGLGCKSALAYAPTFTIVSIKDGVRITVVVGRDEAGGGTMEVADTSTTDEPNGTEVIIATKKYNGLSEKAARFFRFWQPGTVLLNGEKPNAITGEKITDDILVVEDLNRNYIVMGNVAYPVDEDRLPHGLTKGKLVVTVPIGGVSFPPSREALRYTPRTKDTLDEIVQTFHASVDQAVIDAVANASSGPEAIKAVAKWGERLPHIKKNVYKYKGRFVPQKVEGKQKYTYAYTTDSKLSGSSQVVYVHSNVWHTTLFVTGFDVKFNATHKKKLIKHLENNGLSLDKLLLLPTGEKPPAKMWLGKNQVVTWETIKAIKLPRNGSTGHIPGSYEVASVRTYATSTRTYVSCTSLTGDEIADLDCPVYWSHRENGGSVHQAERELAALEDGAMIVLLASNRVAKFERYFPDMEKARDAVQARYTKWSKTLKKADRLALAIYDEGAQWLKKLDVAKVDDPALKAAIRAAGRDIEKVKKQRGQFGQIVNTLQGEKWTNPMDKYPLVDRYEFDRHSDHAYIYINAVHAA